ncbi:MAG: hypothetical protein JWO09_1065 [Bacteroidetes bacterium]|nr:hypothetical protein [Bacteroidota bacterium]
MKKTLHNSYILGLLLLLLNVGMSAQTVPQGITYQGLARNSSGNLIVSQPVSLKVGIYATSVSGTPEWEEVHAVTTSALGLFYTVVGQGTSTGAGTAPSFAAVNWGAAAHFIRIAMDETGGSSYVNIDTIQFWSVPYAMYSGNAGNLNQPLRISQLSDVDTVGVNTGSVLKWNGSLWVPAMDNDSDTALYASSADHANTADTATYATNVLSTIDTVPFSYNADSALYSTSAGTSVNSVNSDYCDTATYALNTGSSYTYWNLTGNTGTTPTSNFLGTTDNKDLAFRTNNIERMRITSAGKIGIGTSTPTATLHIVGNDGLVAEGTFGTGVAPPTGAGTRMIWYPKKAAFRSGGVSSNQWDDVNIGNYSFASGYNTKASGAYSTAFGSGSIASGQYSVAACELATASGISSVAMGSVAQASGPYSIALGRAPMATDSFAIAIGYHNTATAKYAISIGNQTDATGRNSIAMGYYSSSNAHTGCFVYADGSGGASSMTLNTADNQFMVRASGGTIFYSNAAMTAGVSLPAGGGSWASVSDKNKKEHFKKESGDAILKKLDLIEVTSWNYKTQAASIRHIGPMAQDFYKAFSFGESDTTITTIDMDGISLIAIQALSRKTKELQEKAAEVERLKATVSRLEAENMKLEKRIAGMEQKLNLTPASVMVLKQAGSN